MMPRNVQRMHRPDQLLLHLREIAPTVLRPRKDQRLRACHGNPLPPLLVVLQIVGPGGSLRHWHPWTQCVGWTRSTRTVTVLVDRKRSKTSTSSGRAFVQMYDLGRPVEINFLDVVFVLRVCDFFLDVVWLEAPFSAVEVRSGQPRGITEDVKGSDSGYSCSPPDSAEITVSTNGPRKYHDGRGSIYVNNGRYGSCEIAMCSVHRMDATVPQRE